MARKPAITGLHSQGIVDDIIKLGVKGASKAIKLTSANKKYVKNMVKTEYPVAGNNKKVVQAMRNEKKSAIARNSGSLSYKTNISRAANNKKVK